MSDEKPKRKTGVVARPAERSADSAERAYRTIRRELVEFRIRPKERINEVHIARDLQLSRTPVREALNRLASEGFVTFSPNRGFFFRDLDIDGLVDLFEIRMVVETGAFALSCERAEDADIRAVDAFWIEAKERYGRRDADEILEMDEKFHLMLAELSGNPEIVAHLTALNARIRFIRRIQIVHAPLMDSLLADHSAIVAAALRRDAAEGCRLLRAHISMTVADARIALKEALLRLYTNDGDKIERRWA